MLNTTDYCAETTETNYLSDALSDTLRSMRIGGSVLLREAYAAPWGVAIPSSPRLAALFGVKAEVRVVAFHLVTSGHCEIRLENGDEAVIEAGEMAVCFAGIAHKITQGANPKIVSVETLLAGNANTQRPQAAGLVRSASLLCGAFLLHDTFLNPLFAALPPLLHTRVSHPNELHNLSGLTNLMAQEVDRKSIGSGYIVERLLEALCAEVIRAHIAASPRQDVGWLNAIKDPVVGRAVAAIHAQPGDHWSVARLAQGVAMSPSRFAARFTATLGSSPMAYVAQWRMNVACRLLAGTRQSIGQIATGVGYENLAAFSRAFKKHAGVAPAAWRTGEQRAI